MLSGAQGPVWGGCSCAAAGAGTATAASRAERAARSVQDAMYAWDEWLSSCGCKPAAGYSTSSLSCRLLPRSWGSFPAEAALQRSPKRFSGHSRTPLRLRRIETGPSPALQQAHLAMLRLPRPLRTASLCYVGSEVGRGYRY